MAKLEIRYFTGDVEEYELSREQPVSIGRSSSNDVCIDEDDVEPMHCRIAWDSDGYVLTAAQPEGVEVNGTLVKSSALNDEDVIRIGTVDIHVSVELEAAVTRTAAVPSSRPAAGAAAEEFEPAAAEPPLSQPRAPQPELTGDDDYEDEERKQPAPADERDGEPSAIDRIRRRLDRESVRPGDREVIRSKFLIGIVVSIAVLALVCGVLWFWINLNAAEKLKVAADEKYNGGKYQEAINLYTDFLKKFPENEYTTEVFFKRAKARVEKEIAGSAPKWAEGLEQVDAFIKENENREGYSEQREAILAYAMQIALGACKSASVTKKREYLPVAVEARNLARRFKPEKKFEDDFKSAYELAEYEVRRKEMFDAGVKQIKAAIASKSIDAAVQSRLDLIQKLNNQPRRYEQTTLKKLLDETMASERSLVLAEDLNRDAETKDRPGRHRNPRTLTPYVRPQESRVSDKSQIVIGRAKNCCYGVDAITGEPLWRRVTGRDLPFFPMTLTVRGATLLYYDTDYGDLTLIGRNDGRLIWRQPLLKEDGTPELLAGAPLVSQGQIFLPTLSRRLYRIDLNSGRVLRRLTFSQRLLAPPVMAPTGDRLIVAGDKALVYTVKLDPKLKCQAVTYVGHRPGSVRVPLMPIGKLVLMCENIGSGKNAECRLRVLDSATKNPDEWLRELTFADPNQQVRVPGHLLEPPVVDSNRPELRGKLLFVVSGGRYVTVFTVSDDTNQPESERTWDQFLRRLDAPKEFETPQTGPVFIVTAPNRVFYVVSSELSKYQLATKTIRTPEVVPFTHATQPPQKVGEKFYLGRQGAFSEAVTLSETDPQTMRGTWSVTLGAKIIAWNHTEGQPIVCLNEEGLVFRVQPQDIANGGFHLESTAALPMPRGLKDPLRALALPDGGLIAAAGSEKAAMWIVNSAGQIVQTIRLPSALQADPILLGDGVVLPLKGRLRYLSLKGGGTVQDFQLPFNADKEPPAWAQLAALNPSELVALTSEGNLLRVQIKTGGSRAFLSMAQERQFVDKPQPGFAVHQGNVIVGDTQGKIHILNSATLQPSTSVDTGASRVNRLWVAEGHLFAETDRSVENGAGRRVERRLHFYAINNGLKQLWVKPLENNTGLAGVPVVRGGQLMLAQRNGKLTWIDPAGGKAQKTIDLADAIASPPRSVGGEYLVPTLDGSLMFVPSGG